MTDFIGEILLDQVPRRSRRSKLVEALVDWLRAAARPPPGVELESADGALFTGLVIVDRNRPVLMLAARQAAAPRPRYQSPPGYPGAPNTTLQHRLFDEEEERHGDVPPWWRR